MNKELDILFLEGDIACEQCEMDTDAIIVNNIFTEAVSDDKSMLQKIIERIKKLVSDIKDKIQEFFSKKKTKDLIKNTEDAMKKDPKLKNVKIKVPNFDKLDKLFSKTKSAIIKNPDKADEILEKHNNAQKILLTAVGVGAIGGAVSVGTAIAWFKKIDKSTDLSWTTDLSEDQSSENAQARALKQAKGIEKLLKLRWAMTKSYLQSCTGAINGLRTVYVANDKRIIKDIKNEDRYNERASKAKNAFDRLQSQYAISSAPIFGVYHSPTNAKTKEQVVAAANIANSYRDMAKTAQGKLSADSRNVTNEFNKAIKSKKK